MNKHCIICLLSLLFLFSCTTSKTVTEVPVILNHNKETKIQSTIIDSVFIKDTVYCRDSIYIKEKGDTVFINKVKYEYKYKTKYQYVTRFDTVSIVDSIPYPVTVTEVKEIKTNYLTWLQKTLMYIGIATSCVVLGIVGYKAAKIYLKTKL